MEDFEKIQHREHQRQQLLKELKRCIWDKVDDLSPTVNGAGFYYGIVVAAIDYINGVHASDQKANFRTGANFFDNAVLLRIGGFTPVHTERHLLAGDVLKFAIDSILQPVYSEMLRLAVPPARDQFFKDIGLDKLE